MQDRVAALRQRLNELDISAFLISSLSHIRYLFGFSGSHGLAFVDDRHCLLVTDRRYEEQVQHEVTNAEVRIAAQDLFEPLKALQPSGGKWRLGFEAAYLTYRDFSRLKDAFSGAQLVATENLLERLTVARTEAEVAATRRACEIAAEVWQRLLPLIRPGVAELDLSAEISYQCKKLGAEGDAFEPIIASGWRSALPHGIADRKPLQAGEFVVIDFGCRYQGFHSDVTRTVFVGRPGERERKMYQAVRQANELAVAAVRADMPAVELDAVARKHLKACGFEKEFPHSLGHGLGLEVHSMPRIGPKSKDTVPAHSIITIEPGVYIPGFGGVRIEDDVWVHPDGAQVLTRIDRELITIE